jgi:hypothetical protein
MGGRLPENKVVQELEEIIHQTKRADEMQLDKLDVVYRRKLSELAKMGYSYTVERFTGYYAKRFHRSFVPG